MTASRSRAALLVPLAAALAAATACAGAPAAAPGAAAQATMKAIRFHAFGGPEVLRYEDAPRPTPREGELLLRVHAAGVNPVDWKVRQGTRGGSELPKVPGCDVSGDVAVVGPGVARFKAGDAVFAFLPVARSGGYAEFAIVREDEAVRKPSKADHVHAAAIPLAAVTAWQALFDAAHLAAGQKLLVHGAAGGVGSFAVQLAKATGATVVGTASEKNLAFLRELGADDAIDYQEQRFEEVVKDADVVLDTVGGDTLVRSARAVKAGGLVVTIAGDPATVPKERDVRALAVRVQPDAAALARIAALVDEGKVRPAVSEVLPLAEARRAQEESAARHVRGKIVLRVREE